MTLYQLKPAFQNLLRPIVKLLNKFGISPNTITSITCLLSCLFAYFLYQKQELLMYLPFFFFIRMALNAIDGMLAKEFNKQTKTGAMLNELTDVISDAALYMALISHFPFVTKSILLFTFLSLLTEYTGVSAVSIGSQRRFDGPLGKSDRSFFISLIAILVTFTKLDQNVYCYLFSAANILLVMTIINRFKKSLVMT